MALTKLDPRHGKIRNVTYLSGYYSFTIMKHPIYIEYYLKKTKNKVTPIKKTTAPAMRIKLIGFEFLQQAPIYLMNA